jgi:alpha-tubulin suppressor-like RCC1 family protein
MDLSGSLGVDTTEVKTHPQIGTSVGVAYELKPVQTGLRFEQIKTHIHATFGLTTDGKVYVWGHWPAGFPYEDPIPSANYPEPTLLDAGPWERIADTEENTLCLKDRVGFKCMGYTRNGVQGIGPPDPAAPSYTETLTRWPTSENMRALVGGHNAVCGLDTNDQVWCSGLNVHATVGQPFDPVRFDSLSLQERYDEHIYYTPLRTVFEDTFEQIWAGEGRFFCGEEKDEIWCWGSNTFCQLGRDPGSDASNPEHLYDSSSTPVRLDFIPENWRDIDLGTYVGCVIDADGWIHCWGLSNGGFDNPFTSGAPLQCDPGLQRVYPYEPRE